MKIVVVFLGVLTIVAWLVWIPSMEHGDLMMPVVSKRVLVVQELMPSKFSGSNMRLRQICEFFREKNFAVTFSFREPLRGPHKQDAMDWARKFDIDLIGDDEELSRTRDVVKNVDLALLGVWFYRDSEKTICDWMIPHFQGKKTKVLLVSDVVHYLRCSKEPACRNMRSRRELERQYYSSPHIDAVISICEEDKERFEKEFHAVNTIVLPMLLRPKGMEEINRRVVSTEKHLVYFGSCHESNTLTFEFLVRDFAKVLDSRKEQIRLTVAGCSQWKVAAKLDHVKIELVGEFDTLESLLTTSTVMVLPGEQKQTFAWCWLSLFKFFLWFFFIQFPLGSLGFLPKCSWLWNILSRLLQIEMLLEGLLMQARRWKSLFLPRNALIHSRSCLRWNVLGGKRTKKWSRFQSL